MFIYMTNRIWDVWTLDISDIHRYYLEFPSLTGYGGYPTWGAKGPKPGKLSVSWLLSGSVLVQTDEGSK